MQEDEKGLLVAGTGATRVLVYDDFDFLGGGGNSEQKTEKSKENGFAQVTHGPSDIGFWVAKLRAGYAACPRDETHEVRLEIEFQGELNDARVVDRCADDSETGRSINVLHAAGTARQEELSMVPYIEEFSAEVQFHAFIG